MGRQAGKLLLNTLSFAFQTLSVLLAWKYKCDIFINVSGLDIWKKTYGFDWADWVPGNSIKAGYSKLHEHCLREEYGEYAQKCKKKSRFFKCGGTV